MIRGGRHAGITPTYRFLDGDDPVAVIAALNTKRRNLNASQRALAAASAWRDAEAQGRTMGKGEGGKSGKIPHLIKRPDEYFANLFGSNAKYALQAKAVLDASPKIAEAVKAGAKADRPK